MVLLVVKGTTHPDEFLFECPLETCLDPETDAEAPPRTDPPPPPLPIRSRSLPAQLAHIQRARFRLRAMLLAARELLDATAAPPPADADAREAPARAAYRALLERLSSRLAPRAGAVVGVDEFDRAAAQLRRETAAVFPRFRGDDAAALADLTARHAACAEDPATQRAVAHARVIFDDAAAEAGWGADAASGNPGRNAHGGVPPVALWFAGRPMRGALTGYCQGNARTRLTVKLAPARRGDAAEAPSREPGIGYDAQRALATAAAARRARWATLEAAELRDRVERQSRGDVRLPASSPAAGARAPEELERRGLTTSSIRPICPRMEERLVG